jgi:hypothetical protein
MKGIMAVTELREAWDGTSNFKVQGTGHLFFSANVIYQSARRGQECSVNAVHIIRNGNKDGTVSIMEGDELSAETHHLELSHRFQTYTFDPADNSLIIEGDSKEKMGGGYSIKIVPNGLPASWT